MVTISEWNVLDGLSNEDVMTAYLQDALEEERLEGFLDAATDVMRAKAILLMSKESGIDYKTLCKMFTGRSGNAPEISPDVLARATKAFAAPVQV